MRVPVLTSAALAATLVAAVAGPASAADPEKGAGSALSSGSLVQLAVAGQALEALRLSMPTSTGTDGVKALVSVTPLLRDGAPVVPAVEVPAGQKRELPSQSADVAGLLRLASPSGGLTATTDATSALAETTADIGDLSLLGTDLFGEGSLSVTSKVTDVSATGTKRLVVDGLTLPTLADLLGLLGLDLSRLPVDTLLGLLDRLGLLTDTLLTQVRDLVQLLDVTTVEQLLGTLAGDLDGVVEGVTDLAPAELQTLLDTAGGTPGVKTSVTELVAEINALEGTLTDLAASGVRSSAVDLTSPVPAITEPTTSIDLGLPTDGTTDPIVDTVQDVVTDIGAVVDGTTGEVTGDVGTGVLAPVLDLVDDPALSDAIDGLLGDLEGVDTVEELIALVEELVATLLETLSDVLTKLLTPLLETLTGALPTGADLPALLDTPLVSMDGLDVTTIARTGADEVADVSGTVTGLEVLGTDVLSSVLGSPTADLDTLLGGGSLTQVQQLVDGTLGSVTDVLADVTGLNLPLPEVEVLRVVEETLTDVDGVRTARAGVEALSLTWALDEVRIPAPVSSVAGGVTGGLPVSLPLGVQASALPTALPAAQLGALLSEPLSLTVGALADTSGFVPGAAVAAPGAPGTGAGTPGTGGPGTVLNPAPVRQLPRTGASALLAGAALVLIGGAFALRRRNEGLASE